VRGLVVGAALAVLVLAACGDDSARRSQTAKDLTGTIEVVFKRDAARVLRPVRPLTQSQLRAAALVERARLNRFDPKHVHLVRVKDRRLVVSGAIPAGAAAVLSPKGAFSLYDLEGVIRPPSRRPDGRVRPSRKRLRPRAGTTVLSCGPTALACPGVSAYPIKRTVYYRVANRRALDGDDLIRSATNETDLPVGAAVYHDVFASLTRQGQKRFKEMTATMAARGKRRGRLEPFAVVLDQGLLSYARIDYHAYPSGLEVSNGLQIATLATRRVAKTVTAILAGGELPTSFAVVR
jgi:hypothetical protein